MTPKETHDMNLRMADEVMQWKRFSHSATGEWLGWYGPNGNYFAMALRNWSPCTDIKQAFELIEAMRKLGVSVTISPTDGTYRWNYEVEACGIPGLSAISPAEYCQFSDLCFTIVKVICQALDAGKDLKLKSDLLIQYWDLGKPLRR